MVRISECFQCGAKENEAKLIINTEGPVLCEKCNSKHKK